MREDISYAGRAGFCRLAALWLSVSLELSFIGISTSLWVGAPCKASADILRDSNAL
jgi:hypothetical protein